MKTRSRIVALVVTFIIWMLLSFKFEWQHASAGIIVALAVALAMGDLFTGSAHKWLQPKRYLWFCVYVFIFAYECLKANIDVAARVLSPRLPINPGIVKVKTALRTETGIALLANSITLTPGTLTIDVDKANGFMYIHCVDVKTQDIDKATELLVSKFERIIKEVFE